MTGMTAAPIKDVVRTFNKHVLNPVMLLVAGRKHWYAGVIRHTGRRTQRSYDTPVVAVPVAGGGFDGFVIPLPYGTGVDWLRNVLAAGKATITVGGETYEVIEPVVMDAEAAAALLPDRRRRAFARFGIGRYLRLRCAELGRPSTARR